MRQLFILYLTIVIVAELALLAAHFVCLPDTDNRFFMGRGTMGQCLYAEGNAVGEVWE